MIFCLDAFLAWMSLTPFVMNKLEDWSYQYLKLDCKDKDRCYGVLAVSNRVVLISSSAGEQAYQTWRIFSFTGS